MDSAQRLQTSRIAFGVSVDGPRPRAGRPPPPPDIPPAAEPHAKAKTPRYRKLTTYLPGQTITVQVAGKKLGELAVNALFTAKK